MPAVQGISGFIGEQLAQLLFNTGISDADQHGSLLLVANQASTGSAYIIDLESFGYASTPGAPLVMPFADYSVSHSFITPTKVVFSSFQSHSTPVIFDITTGVPTTLSSALFGTSRTQGTAVDISASKAFALSYTGNQFMAINGSTNAVSTVTATFGSSKTFLCVIKKPGANANFLVGVTDGSVVETDISGATIATLVLPGAYDDGFSAIPFIADQMAMEGDDLMVMTTSGILLHYKYSTSTLLEKRYVGKSVNINSGSQVPSWSLGPVVNGLFAMYPQQIDAGTTVLLMSVSNLQPIMEIDCISNGESIKVVKAAVNASTNTFWVVWFDGTVSVFAMPGANSDTETTRIQDPAGVDATGRILRIPYFYRGMSRVEYDGSATAGVNTISTQYDDLDYVEVATDGTRNVNEKADVRMYQG